MKAVGLGAVLLGGMWSLLGSVGLVVVSTWPWHAGPSIAYGLASGVFAIVGSVVLRSGIGALRGRPAGLRGLVGATRAIAVMALAVGGGIAVQMADMGVRPLGVWLAPVAVSTLAGVWMALGFGRSLRRRLDALDESAAADESGGIGVTRDRRPFVWFAIGAGVVGVVIALWSGIEYGLPRLHPEAVRPPPADLVATVCIRGRSSTVGPHPSGQPATGSLQMDTTEITVDQYRACENAGACEPSQPPEDGVRNDACTEHNPGLDDHPINCLSAEQAQAFCLWIGERLPTADEWSFVAFANDGRPRPWGFEISAGHYNGDALLSDAPPGPLPRRGRSAATRRARASSTRWTCMATLRSGSPRPPAGRPTVRGVWRASRAGASSNRSRAGGRRPTRRRRCARLPEPPTPASAARGCFRVNRPSAGTCRSAASARTIRTSRHPAR